MDPNSLVKAVVASGCCNKHQSSNNCGTVPQYVSTSAMPPINNYMYPPQMMPPQMMMPQQFQYPMMMPIQVPVYQDSGGCHGGCHHCHHGHHGHHHRPPWYYDDYYDYGLPPPLRERRRRRRRRKRDNDAVQVFLTIVDFFIKKF